MTEMFSFKKRLLLAALFGIFFIILFLISLFAKNGNLSKISLSPTPTLVPVEVSKNNGRPASAIKIEAAPAAQNNGLGSVSFRYANKNVPTSSAIYTQAPTSIPADTISKLQEKLIAGGTERIINTPGGQVIFMIKETKTLTIYLYSRMVVYSDSSPEATTAKSTTELVGRASDFIKSLTLPVDKSTPSIKYFLERTGDLIETNSPASADVTDISFRELVQGLTVFRQFGSDAAAHVWFSRTGGIKKFTYFYSPQYVPQKSITLPLLSDAEEMIRDNKGTIVSLGDDYQQTPLESPTSTVFSSVEVGYFNNGKDAFLYPVFVFKGTSLVEDSANPITVYLPIAN